ncbi:MAG: ABC transporter permease [Armatimonadetes bacterium]|nr:ABC transporter permease [Armatimonadota bacterium]
MKKFLVVARHEFSTNVRRWEFLVVTLGLPIATALLILLASVPNMMYLQSRKHNPRMQTVAVVNPPAGMQFRDVPPGRRDLEPAGRLEEQAVKKLKSAVIASGGGYRFRVLPTAQEAISELTAGKVDYVYDFAPDYLATGTVDIFQRQRGPFDLAEPPPMSSILRDQLIGERLSQDVRERVRFPIEGREIFLDKQGKPVSDPMTAQLSSLVVPYAMMMLLMMALLGSSTYILRSLVEERESRVQEILLSSVRPSDLFYGKILGLGCLGLFQVAVWLALASPVAATFVASLKLTAGLAAIFMLYFILGFMLYASIIAGIGAIGTSEKESNQIFAIFVLLFSSPLLFMPILIDSPNGWLLRFFSMFPFTSPLMMVMRAVQGGVPTLDLALSIGFLALAVWIGMRLSLRVFHAGQLMYGKTPTPGEIWRALTRRMPSESA